MLNRSSVVDLFKRGHTPCIYFYLGHGKSQTAKGVALALLEQLCAITGYVPPSLAASPLENHPLAYMKTTGKEVSHRTHYEPKSPIRSSIPALMVLEEIKSTTAITREAATAPISRLTTELELLSPGGDISPTEVLADDSISPHDQTVATGSLLLSENVSSLPPILSDVELMYRPSMSASSSFCSPPSRSMSSTSVGSSNASLITQTNLGDRYQNARPELSAAHKGAHEASRAIDDVEMPDLNTLLVALRDVQHHRGGEILYVILDGWDEENMVDPAAFWNLWDELRQIKCKIFLTSRSQSHFQEDIRVQQIDISADAVKLRRSCDVELYIENNLRDKPHAKGLSPDLFAYWVHKIKDISEGV